MRVVDYVVGEEAGLDGRFLGALPVIKIAGTDEAFRGEAMRYLSELMWNPVAILVKRDLRWRIIDATTFAVATGDGSRRSEIRLILNQAGEVVAIEADDRPRQEGGVMKPGRWFGRTWDYRKIGGRRIPIRAEAGWIVDGEEFVYWRGSIKSWTTVN